MSKEFRNFYKNNKDEDTYFSHINNVNFISKDTSNNKSSDRDERIRRSLDEVMITIRRENRKVYRSCATRFRLKQLYLFGLPIALATGIAVSFISPKNTRVVTKAYETYQVEDIVLDINKGEIVSDKGYYHSSFFPAKFVDSDNHHQLQNSTSTLNFKIYDGADSVIGSFKILSNGTLELQDYKSGQTVNIDKYDFSNSKDIEEEYSHLFDDISTYMQNYLKDRGYSEKAELLEKIMNSEDKQYIINMTIKKNVGLTDVQIYKESQERKTLIVASVLYLISLIITFMNIYLKGSFVLKANNGRLSDDEYDKEAGFAHIIESYKNEFMKAESQRIKKAKSLINEYVSEEDRDSLLTDFELKLKR